MILIAMLIAILSVGLFIYIKHKQAERELHRKERLEEKQEQLMELLRKRKTES